VLLQFKKDMNVKLQSELPNLHLETELLPELRAKFESLVLTCLESELAAAFSDLATTSPYKKLLEV